jgi:hypothetical protein
MRFNIIILIIQFPYQKNPLIHLPDFL